ncbi:hypothetical protein DKX38_017432 [Salix brachista]|uniref:Uncharacterized protein n=1 Tax=Salix brachista TaxID=2182728 RepID=A0A5N5KWJ1_9ROSI|nr:hypothetical protein DKX38_017432 [Salix brachista]
MGQIHSLSKSQEERPSMGEVMEKIEEVVNANDDFTISSVGSMLSSPPEWVILHSVIPETWDTPAFTLFADQYEDIYD